MGGVLIPYRGVPLYNNIIMSTVEEEAEKVKLNHPYNMYRSSSKWWFTPFFIEATSRTYDNLK